ncbi:MAG: biotin--[acetyl-CoA-carboxylase] ligase [Thermoplasmata archaeon]
MSKVSLRFHDVVDSTMEIASDLALRGVNEGTVIVAKTQRRGRGRSGSAWISPEGGAWFSLILKPPIQPKESHKIVLLAGLCVCNVLRDLLELNTMLRWPNDILLERRKLAGVLGEGLQTKDAFYAIVGVGVNTNFSIDAFPEWLKEGAITAMDFLKREIDNESLIETIAQRIVEKSSSLGENYPQILEEWTRFSDTIGRIIEIDGTRTGRAIRLDSEGFLVITNSKGNEQRIVSGKIRYLDEV